MRTDRGRSSAGQVGSARRRCLAVLATLPTLVLVSGGVRAQIGAAPVSGLRDRTATGAPVPAPMTERGAAAIDAVLQGRQPIAARVALKLPKLAENGLSVPMEIRVESPMTVADHVQTVHLIAPVNPTPMVARLHFTPRSGAVAVRTRVRLADTQTLLAFAEMSDGQVFAGAADVIVTLGGCVDPVL